MALIKKEPSEYFKSPRYYVLEALIAYSLSKILGDLFRRIVVIFFTPHTVRSWTQPMVSEWFYLLAPRGMYVVIDR